MKIKISWPRTGVGMWDGEHHLYVSSCTKDEITLYASRHGQDWPLILIASPRVLFTLWAKCVLHKFKVIFKFRDLRAIK